MAQCHSTIIIHGLVAAHGSYSKQQSIPCNNMDTVLFFPQMCSTPKYFFKLSPSLHYSVVSIQIKTKMTQNRHRRPNFKAKKKDGAKTYSNGSSVVEYFFLLVKLDLFCLINTEKLSIVSCLKQAIQCVMPMLQV